MVFFNHVKELVMHRVVAETASTLVVKGDDAVVCEVIEKSRVLGYVCGFKRSSQLHFVEINGLRPRLLARISWQRRSRYRSARFLSRLAMVVFARSLQSA